MSAALAAIITPASRPGWHEVRCPATACGKRKLCEVAPGTSGIIEAVCPRCGALVTARL